MSNPISNQSLSRRAMLRLSAAGALGSTLSLPSLAAATAAAAPHAPAATPHAPGTGLYATLLQHWCDGLIAHQVTGIRDAASYGAFLCPACGIIHGRCGDAVYPLLRVAHTTGDERYLRAALLVHQWSERNVSRADGSWINDVTLSPWQGITVFHTIALAEALEHHGAVLPAAARAQWDDRLARAAKFLDGFMNIATGNINYPNTSTLAFTLCGRRFNNQHYLDRAHALAHETLDSYFTPNSFVSGEGHPQTRISPKGCPPVDLGYNVEESLPSLALYALLNNDDDVLNRVLASLRTHMEFMLPDGGWDNSWGTRVYKWSYWGSRTSDGCHPAYVLLSPHEPAFLEVARRNVELMAACTHDGLLYGGPDYFAHGDHACIHHTFTHAKSLATALDRGGAQLNSAARLPLPREAAYGVKSYPEIGTHLAAIGPWRGTVTEYDFNYVEAVQKNGGDSWAGHATGGALSMLYHRALGPILAASMTEYGMVEISNQQAFTDAPHMTLTPRIEYAADGKTWTSLSDFAAALTAHPSAAELAFDARGSLQTASHQPVDGGDARYRLAYRFTESSVEITAEIPAGAAALKPAPRYILPVISRSGEQVSLSDTQTVHIRKPKGTLVVATDATQGFNPIPVDRFFNLVPGFECVPLSVTLEPGKPVRIRISAV